MGKKTYDWIVKHETGEFPYQGKECYVFTRSAVEDTKDVSFKNGDIVHFVNHLKNKEGKNIWMVGGGELLHSFIKENLVDEMILTVAPSVIGKGIPLFKQGDYQLDLSLKGTRNFNQFVELHYEVNNE
ncbi:Dihydrofolate reductase [Salinibacillus kushneri]|uniref:Dihydrofolate reductase n=1 Tax=Salinibacillus kushneri TaxID=237682 RepID=A0A1I0F1F3_9BACI|nr:Dihydrofolate reductase [Salinibacillus kushneri]